MPRNVEKCRECLNELNRKEKAEEISSPELYLKLQVQQSILEHRSFTEWFIHRSVIFLFFSQQIWDINETGKPVFITGFAE